MEAGGYKLNLIKFYCNKIQKYIKKVKNTYVNIHIMSNRIMKSRVT
jgi:hypothetical protein